MELFDSMRKSRKNEIKTIYFADFNENVLQMVSFKLCRLFDCLHFADEMMKSTLNIFHSAVAMLILLKPHFNYLSLKY
jgi:hypothetical protein